MIGPLIHPTAIVADGAVIADDVRIGAYTLVGADVRLEQGVSVGSHCVLEGRTSIGSNTSLGSHCSLGGAPQDLSYAGEDTELYVGCHTQIREFVTVHRGTFKGGGKTVIGDRCFLMSYVHIGHDCLIGDDVVIANASALAGHVHIHHHANISSVFLAHQFVEVGEYTMLSGLSGTRKSVPPYTMADGRPTRLVGINKIGLRRAGFSAQTIKAIAEAYDLIRWHPIEEALNQISVLAEEHSELLRIVEFYRGSRRGVAPYNRAVEDYMMHG